MFDVFANFVPSLSNCTWNESGFWCWQAVIEMERFVESSSGKVSKTSSKEVEEENPAKRTRYGQSAVWQFFNKSKDGSSAKCIQCGKTYITCGNTTNLAGHLKRMHAGLTVSELPKSSGSILSFIEKKYEASSARKKSLDSSLMHYICSDMRPFSVVENKGFRNFVSTLDPRYELPSRNKLRNTCMQDFYTNMKDKLHCILDRVDYCAITTDCWTSRANESYMTVTCHFINDNFELKAAVLSTKNLIDETNHTSQNIANSLREVLVEWQVIDKVSAIVTDNARNVVKACEILQKRNVPCFAHCINLIVQSCFSLENIKTIMGKCKSIVSFFKSSSIAYAKFKQAQEPMKPYSLKQECPTRWNSAFYMIERILATKSAIAKVLLDTPKAILPLSVDELSVLEDLKQVLSLFEDATVQTSSSSNVTVSLIIPLVSGLLHNLSEIKDRLETDDGRNVCNLLMEGIRQRLLPYEKRTVTRLSTLLDPRFKKEGFFSNTNSIEAENFLENELSPLYKENHPPNISSLPTPLCDKTPLLNFLEKNKTQKIRNSRVDSILTLRQYFNMENINSSLNPLDYWKISTDEPLKMSSKKYLCVPATSTESERMFSKAGLIVSEKRSSLKPKNVDMLVFLNKNEWISNN
ncbi:E3 SUMO-protein ligase ZBED1-like [Anastrepha ludens]|uniref:E3 SUMO-protein ligase ZBED1-like n=1 Tax=Anastrepha ludens TaxID=28586 RepID=UPI0023B06D0A|nr:E3 SUMO-protein ligase ZBED1-like [Anastrepha ludens]